ncbi:unnamed protein product [Schistosoma mattheei]|uniref:Uncharacterized protein n=1 Tax=Schistosoma mattheei TaxID=31246 RepID=A0A3P8H4C1_9TREM|nr:unnamed protein product [Schistosoma mattheei]
MSSSQKGYVLSSVYKIVAVTTHEKENKSSSIMNAVAPNEINHSAIKVSDESNYWDSLVVLPGMGYLNDSNVLDEISYKNEKNMSDTSDDNQEPNAILMDADYSSDPLSTNEIFNKFDENVSEESDPDDRKSSGVFPHYLVTFSGFSIQYGKHVSNKVTLIVT